jgi:hypothetical protein
MGIILTFTNPDLNRYQAYLTKEVSKGLREDICAKAPEVLGGVLQWQCNRLIDKGEPSLESIIEYSTDKENFVFFTIYETEILLMPGLPSYQIKSIGIFNHFIIYQNEING